MMTRLAVWPRRLGAGARLYRRMPARLRRPEPVARLGAALFVLWFAMMFLALGLLTGREATGAGAPFPPFYDLAYFLAAALGGLGLALLLTHRYRLGLGLIAGMLALGQLVTIAAVV